MIGAVGPGKETTRLHPGQNKEREMESALRNRIYTMRPRPSRVILTRAAADTIWTRKKAGEFTSADDFALTSLPAPTQGEWEFINGIKIVAERGALL